MKASAYIKARMAKGLCKADAEAEARDLIAEGLEDDAGLEAAAGVPAARVAQALQDLGLDEEAIKRLSEFAVVNGFVADDGSMAPASADDAAATVDAVVADTAAQDVAENVLDAATDDSAAAQAGADAAVEAAKEEDEDMKTAEFEGALKGMVAELGAAFTAALAPLTAELTAVRKGLDANAAELATVRKGMDAVKRPGIAPVGGAVKPSPVDAPAAAPEGAAKGLTINDRIAIGDAAHKFNAMHSDAGIRKAHVGLMAALDHGTDEQVRHFAAELKIPVPA